MVIAVSQLQVRQGGQQMKPSLLPVTTDPKIGHDIRQRPTENIMILAMCASSGTPLAESCEAEIQIREEMASEFQRFLFIGT